MDRIILNDGQEIEGGTISFVSWNDGILVTVPGMDLVSATILFADTNKTEHMESIFTAFKDIFTGYTQIDTVNYNSDKTAVTIWMYGENAHHERESLLPPDYEPSYVADKILNEPKENQNGPEPTEDSESDEPSGEA